MLRGEYRWQPLGPDQYEAIVTAAQVFTDASGNRILSPLHGAANWQAAETEAQRGDVDLRALMAGLLFEDHDGTDPGGGIALAKVYNFGGIKWANQPGAYDSGIQVPANEQPGTYAGFSNFGGFVAELIRTLNNDYCGPAFQSGDLAGAWAIYVGGPNRPNAAAGAARVQQWQYYLTKYSPEGAATVITGAQIIAQGRAFIGKSYWNGEDGNPPHPSAYWCEAFAEFVPRSLGLDEARMQTALQDGLAHTLATSWPPANGAWVFLGAAFFFQGHAGLWDKERGQLLCTLTTPAPNGTIGYMDIGADTPGLMGWCMPDGAAQDAVAPPQYVVDGYDVGQGVAQLVGCISDESAGRLRLLGKCMGPQHDEWLIADNLDPKTAAALKKIAVSVVAVRFERDVIIWDRGRTPDPWSVRVPLATEYVGLADDPYVMAVLHSMTLAGVKP